MYEELVTNLRNCAEINSLSYCKNGLMKQAADAIVFMSKAYQMMEEAYKEEVTKRDWISVIERLPENDDFVIVAIKDEHGDSPYVYSDFGWYFDRAECWIVDTEQRTNITHWMPLPEPPEEEQYE